MMQRRIPLTPYNRPRAIETVRVAPDGWFFLPPVEPNATLEQRAKMWAMLGDFSRQIKWEINGHLDYMADVDWKDMLTAAMANEKRIAKGLRGGFVSLGVHTSEQSKRWMSDFIAFMYAEGNSMGVRWSEKVDVPGWYRDGAAA
jgi:hypothetical protein